MDKIIKYHLSSKDIVRSKPIQTDKNSAGATRYIQIGNYDYFSHQFHDSITLKCTIFCCELEGGEIAVHNQSCFLERVNFGKQVPFGLNIQ